MISRSSPDWPGLKTWLLEQIAERGRALESPECRIVQTDVLRGEIKALRDLIATVEPPPALEVVHTVTTPGAGY